MTVEDGARHERFSGLAGKVALVTGASRGVGAALAVELASAGCDVACAARATRGAPQRTPGTLDETVEAVEACGRRALAVPTNLAVEAEVLQMLIVTEQQMGPVDILVNNAAITFVGDLDIPMKRHDLVMEVNLRAPFIALRQAARSMRERGGGRILNVSSVAALYPHPGLMSYGMSKVALERLTVDAASQLAEHGVAVNCLRIDVPVASEGFVANTPGQDRSGWEPCEVAAEVAVWMLGQETSYTGRRESMAELMGRGVARSRAIRPQRGEPILEMVNGLVGRTESTFREPYPDPPEPIRTGGGAPEG